MGVVEWPGWLAVLAQETDGLDEFGVAVDDRRHLPAPTVAVLDNDRVPAVDLDVLYVGHVEKWLQPAIAEDRILDRSDVRLFLGWRPKLGSASV